MNTTGTAYVLAFRKAAAKAVLRGGKAEGMKPSEFDPKALVKGTKHELEHTSHKPTAKRIAMDHLVEDPKYYTKLEKIEKKGASPKPAQAPASPFEYVRGAKTFAGMYRKLPLMERVKFRQGLMSSLYGFLSSTPQGIRYALKAIK